MPNAPEMSALADHWHALVLHWSTSAVGGRPAKIGAPSLAPKWARPGRTPARSGHPGAPPPEVSAPGAPRPKWAPRAPPRPN
jgi:hypothetical protein